MNIFYLDHDVTKCAEYHVDKHIVKMILEYAQLLSTAHHLLDGSPSVDCYKATHKNHPSAVWARQSTTNYHWLWQLLDATCKEYTHRYGRVHATQSKGIVNNLFNMPYELPVGHFTEPTQAMPDEFKNTCSIKAYRDYYATAKSDLHKWTKRDIPYWLTSTTVNNSVKEV